MKKYLPFLIVFLFLTSNAFGAALTANHDLNVNTPSAAGTYISPAAVNYVITWFYQDKNFNSAFDVNVGVFLSQNSGDKNATLIANDSNANTYCSNPDGAAGTDVNYFNVTRCTFTWSTVTGAIDGNYVIDVNMVDYNRTAGSKDRNELFKASANKFTKDTNAPSIMGGVNVNAQNDGVFTLNWDTNTGLADPRDFNSFYVWYSTSSFTDCSTATLATVSQTQTASSAQITGLSTGTNYWFCVTSDDVAGNRNNSGTVVSSVSNNGATGGQIIETTTTSIPTTGSGAALGSFLSGNVTLGTYEVPMLIALIGTFLLLDFFVLKKFVFKKRKKK